MTFHPLSRFACLLSFVLLGAGAVHGEPPAATGPLANLQLAGESFELDGRPAFVLLPSEPHRRSPQPWIFYGPTLPAYPDRHERWMHERFLEAGVAVAGIDAGEAYGSPRGRRLMSLLYRELTLNRGFAAKPCLLGRSRGGLWASSWAIANPARVAGIAGIYPVFDLQTYPGLDKAAIAFEMSPRELKSQLVRHNPIERIDVLAQAEIPVCIIHGDRDDVVPLKENSAALARRYEELGAGDQVQLIVAEGRGHSYWEGFFRCEPLVDFAIEQANSAAQSQPAGRGWLNEMAAAIEPSRRVEFKQTGDRGLKLHVFAPPDDDSSTDGRPCFLIFHGGGWTGGEPRRMYPFAEYFSQLGMVGISAEYRLLDKAQGTTVFDCVDDARAAFRFVLDNAETLGIDPQRIVVSGGSAGGHLAAATALFDRRNSADNRNQAATEPAALVLLFPVIDTSPRGYGSEKIGLRWRELSPVHQLRGPVPPTLIFHGTGDTVTPFAGAEAFRDAMQRAGNRCELIAHEGGKHGYLMSDRTLFQQTLDETQRFLRSLDLIDAP